MGRCEKKFSKLKKMKKKKGEHKLSVRAAFRFWERICARYERQNGSGVGRFVGALDDVDDDMTGDICKFCAP